MWNSTLKDPEVGYKEDENKRHFDFLNRYWVPKMFTFWSSLMLQQKILLLW